MTTRAAVPITRSRILDAALALMLDKGFFATSVDEICTAAGVTKGSFFHYFESKQALGEQLIEQFACQQLSVLGSSAAGIEDPLLRIYAIIDCTARMFSDPALRGCLVGTFAQEVSQTHPVLRTCCEKALANFSDALAADFEAAKQRYAPSADFDVESLGGLVVALVQGSLLVFKADGNRAQLTKNLEHLRGYLQMLFGR